jgi:hypothetical protein
VTLYEPGGIMKFYLLSFLVVILGAGCATQKQVAGMEGRGKHAVFSAPYDTVWRAAVDAAQTGDLRVNVADRSNGYIAARRGIRLHTFGENVGIWVKQVSPDQTEVEVVSRQAGPPKFWFKNWEREILDAVAANITREASGPAVIREPAGIEPYSPPVPRD